MMMTIYDDDDDDDDDDYQHIPTRHIPTRWEYDMTNDDDNL